MTILSGRIHLWYFFSFALMTDYNIFTPFSISDLQQPKLLNHPFSLKRQLFLWNKQMKVCELNNPSTCHQSFAAPLSSPSVEPKAPCKALLSSANRSTAPTGPLDRKNSRAQVEARGSRTPDIPHPGKWIQGDVNRTLKFISHLLLKKVYYTHTEPGKEVTWFILEL